MISLEGINTLAAFDFARELLGLAKSPSEFIELSTAQTRKQFDLASAQNKELCALAHRTATDAAQPIKIGMSKAFKQGHRIAGVPIQQAHNGNRTQTGVQERCDQNGH